MRTRQGGWMGVGGFIVAAVLVMLAARPAAGSPYDWNVTGGGNWSDPTKWSPSGNYPKAGDAAAFTGAVAQTVNIATGSQTAETVNVTGSANWTWATPANFLSIGAGAFNYYSTGTGTFSAVLAGGPLVIYDGVFYLGNAANTFSGGIVVNRGNLYAGTSGSAGGSGYLGAAANALNLGKVTSSTTDDVSLAVSGGGTFTQPVTIRSGNSGTATIKLWNNQTAVAKHSGGIALQKGLTLRNDALYGYDYNWTSYDLPYYVLEVGGPIAGSGDLTVAGIGFVKLSGTNTYTGATVVDGGRAILSATNDNLGHCMVRRGLLIVATNESLGKTANTLTLGSAGAFGRFGVLNATKTIDRTVTLAGAGGWIASLSGNAGQGRPRFSGDIGGEGKLIVNYWTQNYRIPNETLMLNGNNTYSGGTIVVSGLVDVETAYDTRRAYGNGHLTILNEGIAVVRNAANLATDRTVTVKRANSVLPGYAGMLVVSNALPPISADSDGFLAFLGNPPAAVNTALADATKPIGNGKMWLAANYNSSQITATSLVAVVGHSPDYTYRLGSSHAATILNTPTTEGALRDLNGHAYNVEIGQKYGMGSVSVTVYLQDSNTFSGTLTINPFAMLTFSVPATGGNPLGDANGNVAIYGCGRATGDNNHDRSIWLDDRSSTETRTFAKSNLTWYGGSVVNVRHDQATGANTVQFNTLTCGSIGGTLGISSWHDALGGKTKFVVAGATKPPLFNGNTITETYYWDQYYGNFLTYDNAIGFTNVTYTINGAAGTVTSQAQFDTAVATDIVKVEGANIDAGTKTVYALTTTNALTAGTLTLDGGAIILRGYNKTHAAGLTFPSGVTGIVYAVNNVGDTTRQTRWDMADVNTINGAVTAPNGLIKSGPRAIKLGSTSSSIAGQVYVVQGALIAKDTTLVGCTGVTLDGGAFFGDGAVTVTKDFTLGQAGAILGGQGGTTIYSGGIAGANRVLTVYGSVTFSGGGKTWSGGTRLLTATAGAAVTVQSDSNLGTGDVVTERGAGINLYLNGAGNIAASAGLILIGGHANAAYFRSASPTIGSLEGDGSVALGTDSITTTLTVGGNNRSTDFFGQINDGLATSWQTVFGRGNLTKTGTGTLTLWGENTYSGNTTVNGGVLALNNYHAGGAGGTNLYTVNNTGTLTVNGTIPAGTGAVTVNVGGTLNGSGIVRRTVTVAGGTLEADTLTLAGATFTGGGVLSVAINGTTPGTGYDQLINTGALDLSGATLSLQLGYVPAVGATFTIVANSGTLAAQLSGRIVTATHGGKTYYFAVSYPGNNVVLTALPIGTVISIR